MTERTKRASKQGAVFWSSSVLNEATAAANARCALIVGGRVPIADRLGLLAVKIARGL